VTPDKTPEEIEREMLHTRESITEKVAALEHQVVGTVQTAADTITNTVEAVKSLVTTAPGAVTDTVKQAAAAVSETVKETFNVTGCVRRNPWAAVGTTTLFGCLVGYLTGRRESLGAPAGYVPAAAGAVTEPLAAPAPARAAADGKPGVLDEFFGMIGDRVQELARTALETVSAAVKEQIQTGVPKLVGDAASRLTDTSSEEPPFAARFDARRTGV
jgi:ElaB/YqjD/DUF883 family membrane-anchored ribosome-binding protein